jgi:hypothetical protein
MVSGIGFLTMMVSENVNPCDVQPEVFDMESCRVYRQYFWMCVGGIFGCVLMGEV